MNQTEKINQQLYEKLSQEYSSFIDGLKQLSPEEIIEHSYEKVFKEDILTCFECDDMPYAKAKALLSLKSSLNDLYEEWLSTDCTHMECQHIKSKQKSKQMALFLCLLFCVTYSFGCTLDNCQFLIIELIKKGIQLSAFRAAMFFLFSEICIGQLKCQEE